MLEQVRKNLKEITIKEVMRIAVECDLSYQTLLNIRYEKEKKPTYETVQKLHDFFNRKAGQ